MTDTKYSFIDSALESRRKEKKFRELRPLEPGDANLSTRESAELVNFCSNDYLGLSMHPAVVERARAYTERYGAGAGASRLISGTYGIHDRLEQKLAETFAGESSLIFNSGFQANSSIIATLTDRHSLVLADRLSHSSLLQGALLSRADFQRFNHNDTAHLRELLEKARSGTYSRILIVTETVFSMDGDRSDIPSIAGLAEEFGALLFVDDAHAVGVWGEEGLGLAKGVQGVDILLGTCGKAFGSFGAYVICSQKMRSYLVNFCPGFIYTTAPPPSVVGAVDAALELIPAMNEERRRYHERIEHVRREIAGMGYATGRSTTQIIPLITGEEYRTLKLARWLEQQGILATAIRPPTVPEESSRIRITLTATHSDEQIDYLLNKLKEWKDAES